MKLLHVICSLNPSNGGTVEGLKQMVTALIQRGHNVEVATADDPLSPWMQGLTFQVHALGPSKLRYGYAPRLVPWLQKHAGNYDAVIVEGLWQYHGYATWKALHKMKVPYFVFAHGMLSPWFRINYPLKHLKKWLYWPWAEYRVLRDAKAVLFTAEEERILSRQSFWLYRCNERVVGYGTVSPPEDAQQQCEDLFTQYPGLRDKRLFLYLGRIHEVKGCDILIEAFAKFSAVDPSLHLVMAGPDQTGWRKELVALGGKLGIEDRITWTGMLSGNVKWGAYRAAEVFVLPSHQENFGVVVAEALACGLPTLISNKINIWREIQADRAGIVADDTLAGMTQLLDKWLSMDAAAQSAMRERAIACFCSRFRIDKAAQNLIDLIAECNEAMCSGATRNSV
jgi:glycosyltransferase involved in cell wall biosynthesis